MVDRDLSDMEVLPDGMPLFGLEKQPLVLKLCILTEAQRKGYKPRIFVGLVVKKWLVVPLDYVETMEDGLESLKSIISGFTRIGFKVIAAEVDVED